MVKKKESLETNRNRQKRFHQNMKDKGYCFLCQWVPEKLKKKAKDFVKKLKEG